MDKDFAPDSITLVDDQNVEHNFEILDTIENEKGLFYALYPVFDEPQDAVEDDGEYYIMEVIDDNGEEQLAEVEDDDLLDELAEIFEARFEKLFSEE